MEVIYLPGNSVSNKAWIETVKSKFDTFSSGEILYYEHWINGNKWIDVKAESTKLAELVKDKSDYFVLAKSVGTILALKGIFEKTFCPRKAIFCGFPYEVGKQESLPIDDYLRSLSVPTIFLHNEFDPVLPFTELKKVLSKVTPASFQLIKNPNNATHDYEDYDQLVALAKEFFQ